MDFIKILDLSNTTTIFSIKDASTKIEPGIKVLYDNKFLFVSFSNFLNDILQSLFPMNIKKEIYGYISTERIYNSLIEIWNRDNQNRLYSFNEEIFKRNISTLPLEDLKVPEKIYPELKTNITKTPEKNNEIFICGNDNIKVYLIFDTKYIAPKNELYVFVKLIRKNSYRTAAISLVKPRYVEPLNNFTTLTDSEKELFNNIFTEKIFNRAVSEWDYFFHKDCCAGLRPTIKEWNKMTKHGKPKYLKLK